MWLTQCVVPVVAVFVIYARGALGGCEPRVRLQSGWACGVWRASEDGAFASFLGVPYAQQPLGERRFSELEPVRPWHRDVYNATFERPHCPQYDVFYGELMSPAEVSEACIYANIHVPLEALSAHNATRRSRPGLPILVFIHGGGFAFGSYGTALYGPEYLMRRGVIVITFNYRLNVFGYLSLNSPQIPGNNGLRDSITLLKWVRANARAFGGDPDDVTLAGQSAGSAMAHLLSMSNAARGLFRRVILMSGTAVSSFVATSPVYADIVANLFLTNLGLNATDPELAHRQLIKLPLQDIMDANQRVQDALGIIAFQPVVESPHPGVTMIVDDDPEALLAAGRGRHLPLIIGYTDRECEPFRSNFERFDILNRINENPTLILSPSLIFKFPPIVALDLAQRSINRYLGDEPNMDKYLKSCSDTFYVYPALKLAEKRAAQDSAPVFLYQYSYTADFSAIQVSKGMKYHGAGHVEDMTFVFRPNAMEGRKGFSPPTHNDYLMTEWMTTFVSNFMRCNDPTCNQYAISNWPPVDDSVPLKHQDIHMPGIYRYHDIPKDQQETKQFFDSFENQTS